MYGILSDIAEGVDGIIFRPVDFLQLAVGSGRDKRIQKKSYGDTVTL